jgi:hypothetical protein
MIAYTQKDYALMVSRRVAAFRKIAHRLGKDHQITKMMGGLSYGRYEGDPGTDSSLRAWSGAKGYLDGYFACLNLWARDHDSGAQMIMLDEYPRGYAAA